MVPSIQFVYSEKIEIDIRKTKKSKYPVVSATSARTERVEKW